MLTWHEAGWRASATLMQTFWLKWAEGLRSATLPLHTPYRLREQQVRGYHDLMIHKCIPLEDSVHP